MTGLRSLATLLLAVTGTTPAQMKMEPSSPSVGSSVSMPSADSSSAFKELAAQAAGVKWLGLIDNGEYGKAWEECAQLFRQRVTREQWASSLPATRAPLGAVKSRKVDAAAYKTYLPGAPEGQYVTVHFRTSFDKKESAEELITLMWENDAWRPTGYVIK